MMTKWHKGGIYSKNLSVILGALQSVYNTPKDGFRIYALSIADLNALGKHLNKETGQDYPLNRVVLEILSHLTKLEGKTNSPEEEVAIHATAIQNAFFDNLKKLEDVIHRFSSCRRTIELKCHPEASAEWPTVPKRKKAPKKNSIRW
jgi:hypothetical protein